MTDLQPVECEHEGTVLIGQMAIPQGPGRHPAVMVMHDAMGLGDFVRERAQTLASQGYVALATDMYGGGIRTTNLEEVGAHMSALHEAPNTLRARVRTWYDHLKVRPEVDASRVAAIGYCFGGQCVLELARSGADVKAVVSYHGLLATALPAEPDAVKAQVVAYTGEKDPYAPAEHVTGFQKEMADANANWHLTIFGGTYHAFTEPHAAEMRDVPGVKYDALADAVSWAGTLALLKETIG